MSWMKSLSKHYHLMCETHPQSQIMIVFDIDDTIVDIRIYYMYCKNMIQIIIPRISQI